MLVSTDEGADDVLDFSSIKLVENGSNVDDFEFFELLVSEHGLSLVLASFSSISFDRIWG